MSKTVQYTVNDNGVLKEKTVTYHDTWRLRNDELLHHYHYLRMAREAGICPTELHCDIKPTDLNCHTVAYRIGGRDITGLMQYAVGSACPENVKGSGQYYPEMAFKRAYDSWVEICLRIKES